MDKFFDRQIDQWPLAKGNFDALARVETRTLGCGCKVQYNPARMVSTGAKMDAATLRKRPCFLCRANRPIEQIAEKWGDYEILVNPFPIFPRHFTIPLREHAPQRIYGRVADMARLAMKMPGYTVFYNGPRCGASAPDHMHFQAGNSDFLPIWEALGYPTAEPSGTYTLNVDEGGSVHPAEVFGGMGVIVIKGSKPEEVEALFNKVYAQLPDGGEEPMLNLLMRVDGDVITLVVVPRKRHRPSFYGDGEGQMILSPASVDLGGVFITPRREDFDRMDDQTVQRVYAELCMTGDEVRRLCERLSVPMVHVGIMSESQLEFTLHGQYLLDGDKVSGKVSLSARGVKDPLLFTPTAPDCYAEVEGVTIGVNFHWQQRETQCFKGAIKVVRDDDSLVLINILPVEDYLTSVISSEMSATSSLELLKAHAVISRSWLLAQIQNHSARGMRPEGSAPCHERHPVPGTVVRWYDHDAHDLFDVCADDHCQRYQGITRQTTPTVVEAVNATAGQVLMCEGRLVDARFSKCCGGMMEQFEYCWDDTPKPYLRGIRDWDNTPSGWTGRGRPSPQSVDAHDSVESIPSGWTGRGRPSPQSVDAHDSPEVLDLRVEANAREWILSSPEAYCNTQNQEVLRQVLNGYDQTTADFYRWTVHYTADEIADLVRRKSGIDFGRIIDLVPVERGTSGRISLLRIVGERAVMTIGKELEIRRTLSESHLYSSAFVVDAHEDGSFTLHGAGWGHGVGLCQIGAAMMAHEGRGYREILAHYYPGSRLEKI